MNQVIFQFGQAKQEQVKGPIFPTLKQLKQNAKNIFSDLRLVDTKKISISYKQTDGDFEQIHRDEQYKRIVEDIKRNKIKQVIFNIQRIQDDSEDEESENSQIKSDEQEDSEGEAPQTSEQDIQQDQEKQKKQYDLGVDNQSEKDSQQSLLAILYLEQESQNDSQQSPKEQTFSQIQQYEGQMNASNDIKVLKIQNQFNVILQDNKHIQLRNKANDSSRQIQSQSDKNMLELQKNMRQMQRTMIIMQQKIERMEQQQKIQKDSILTLCNGCGLLKHKGQRIKLGNNLLSIFFCPDCNQKFDVTLRSK